MDSNILNKKVDNYDFDNFVNTAKNYYYGDGVEQDFKKAYLYFAKAFAINPKDADLNKHLGQCFFYGNGIAENKEKGVAFFKAAIAFGSIDAHVNLGDAYEYGEGIEKDLEQALNHYTIAMKSGNTTAMVRLGDMYDEGTGVEQDYGKAFYYYKQAADAGDVDGLYWTGCYYNEGKGVEKSNLLACDYWKKAADNRDNNAEFLLGLTLELDDELKNYKEAAYWYKKSADHGNESAICKFALCTLNREDASRREIVEAINYLTRASNSGSNEATFYLAKVYNEGKGVEKNQELAYKLWAKGANAGSGACSRLAGDCCRQGEGTPKDINKALRWFAQGAKQGDSLSALAAGYEYLFGENVDKDYNKALHFFYKASDLGDVRGNLYIARIYEEGEGVKEDLEYAFRHYTIAADAGNADAILSKARFYFYGIGCVENNKEKCLELLCEILDNDCDIDEEYVVNLLCECKAEDLNKDLFFRLISKQAENNNANAQYLMWKYYTSGIYIDKDILVANSWLKKAAEGGNFSAQGIYGFNMQCEGKLDECIKYWEKGKDHNIKIKTDLAILYMTNEGQYKNVKRAIELLKDAVGEGYPPAMYELAICYKNGNGVERDINKALEYLEISGNHDCADAQALLGCLYSSGDQVPVDAEKSVMWFDKAASSGNNKAHYFLGKMNLEGKIIQQNINRAIYHFKEVLKDIDNEHYLGAQFYCGVAYSQISKYSEAFSCFIAGAKRGDALCQHKVGLMYYSGLGRSQDLKEAQYWLEEASKNGVSESAKTLLEVNKEIKKRQ